MFLRQEPMSVEDHRQVITSHTFLLVERLSDNPRAYCRILAILFLSGVLIQETYRGMTMQVSWSSKGKKTKSENS